MTEFRALRGLSAVLRRARWIHLAPVLAFLALSAWAFASPIGSAPDDDFHLASIWCADGGSALCQPGANGGSRDLSTIFADVVCYAEHPDLSAACQDSVWGEKGVHESERGNFASEYPPVYYAVMGIFAGGDVQLSAVTMRLVNAALFVALATALTALLPLRRRTTLLWGWLVTLVPLGMFLIPSNNPSGWAVTGVGTAFLALLGWFETAGARRWALGAIYLVGVLMAAGSRGDAAVYIVGASVTAALITWVRTRGWAVRAVLPLAGIAIAAVFLLTATQSSVGATGFGGSGYNVPSGAGTTTEGGLTGGALAAYNLLMLPYLWSGVWGTWSLGWFDTTLPALVSWAAVAAFIVVAFAGLARLDWRKAISAAGVLLVLIVLPVYVLTAGNDVVGAQVQPRYLLPLVVLFAFVLLTLPAGARLRFTRIQTFTIAGALAVANLIALQVDIRRYVTGAHHQSVNLDAGAQWWWPGLPVGPTAVWLVGSLAYAGLIVVLWPWLRDSLRARRPASGRVDSGESHPAPEVDQAPV